MMLPVRYRAGLRHRDRWRVAEMLRENPDLLCHDPGRDMDLWRHLFGPDDLVRVGDLCQAACEAAPAESCSGNTWSGEVIEGTVAVCWPAAALLRAATCKDAMTRSQACEAVIGRLRADGAEIVMVVTDGDRGLECWLDHPPGSLPVPSSGRCPGGKNSRTGRVHRVVWAHPVTRIGWEEDDWSAWEAAQDGSQ